ncbi:MAG: HD domain-containing protein [Nitrospirae bacterium]|nr:HD domain-containing protein [Nitrospirota bacterium]
MEDSDFKHAVEELARIYEEMDILYTLSENLAAEKSIKNICEKIAGEIMDALEVNSVSIMFVDEERGDMYTEYSTGFFSKPVRINKGEGIPGYVITTMKPLIVCDTKKHPLSDKTPYIGTSVLCVPLIVKERVLGVIIASDKISKEEFFSSDLKLLSAIAFQAAVAIENARLYQKLEDVFLGTVKSLALALDKKSAWNAGHSEMVTAYAIAIAQEMGLNENFTERLEICGILHDVGKIGIPDTLLEKNEPLNNEEIAAIMRHPIIAVEILENIKGLGDVLQGILHHHERYDGSGSPDGLTGEKIPLMARILTVADAYDAITSDRPYRKKMNRKDAIEEMKKNAGTQFDPVVIDALIKVLMKVES